MFTAKNKKRQIKALFFFTALIFLANLVSASLVILPNPISVELSVNQQKTFSATMTNILPFQISNLQFSNLTGFTFPNITIAPNQTKIINFTVSRNQSFYGTIPSKVSFDYLVDIPTQVTTYQVNISDIDGYNPNYLLIRQGDTVTWTNKDDITHTVTSALFDFTLSPSQSTSYTFNNLGTVDYQDLIIPFYGTIEVINRTSQNTAHNPNYDVIWNVNLNVIANPTLLDVSTLESSFEVSATGSTDDQIKIKNTGLETAEKVTLTSSSSWIIFDANNFNLNKGEAKYVKYTILPSIFNTSDTNQTYLIDLKAKALNSEEYTVKINVTIPYSDISGDYSTSDEAFMVWFAQVYCPQHQDLFICNTSAKGTVVEKVIYKDREIPVNLTATEVYNLLKRIQKIEDGSSRTNNMIKELADLLGLTVPQLLQAVNQSNNKQVQNEKKSNDRWDAVWIIGFFLVLSGGILISVYFYNKKKSKEALMGGQVS